MAVIVAVGRGKGLTWAGGPEGQVRVRLKGISARFGADGEENRWW